MKTRASDPARSYARLPAVSAPDIVRKQAPATARAQMPRHGIADLTVEPPANVPAVPETPIVQMVTTRDQKKKKQQQKKNAEARLARWHKRETQRRKGDRFKTGKYDHPLGPVTVSGINKQRIAQTNQANYGGETFGRMPPYSKMLPHLKFKNAGRAVYDPSFTSRKLTTKQKMAAVLTATTSNVSENDKAPGAGKFIRALARHHVRRPGAPHFLDPKVNSAVSSAPEIRALVTGATPLNADQRRAIDEDASDSSGDDAPSFAVRTKLLKKRTNP